MERGEVLEEMAPLGRGHRDVLEFGFDDDLRTRDLVPGHRYAEPRVRRTPTPHAYEDITHALARERAVDPCHFLRDLRAPRAVEAVDVHHHDVLDAVQSAVPEYACAVAQ